MCMYYDNSHNSMLLMDYTPLHSPTIAMLCISLGAQEELTPAEKNEIPFSSRCILRE